MPQQIPSHDSDLRVSPATTRRDVAEFLADRLAEPAVVDEALVWNFNSHGLDARALVNADLDAGTYVVPYQVSGVWGFMVEILPNIAAEATLLTYQQANEQYEVYPNLAVEDPGGWEWDAGADRDIDVWLTRVASDAATDAHRVADGGVGDGE